MQNLMASVVLGVSAAVIVGSLLSSCSNKPDDYKNKHGIADTKIDKTTYGKPTIVNNADGYPNVSMMCDGSMGYLIITVTHTLSDAPATVVADKRCPGWQPWMGNQVIQGGRSSLAPPKDE